MKKEVVELENGLRQVTTYYYDGKTPKEVYIIDKDDKRDGSYEGYYENGQLKVKCTYKNGEEDGPYEEYYCNGQLDIKCTYKNGMWDGLYEEYWSNGQLKMKCTYKDGKLDGSYEGYYENGQLRTKGTYKDGKRDGISEGYDNNGQPVRKDIYRDGELIDDKLNPDRKGLNKLLQSLDKDMKPTEGRQQIKRQIVKEFRKTHPKNGGR